MILKSQLTLQLFQNYCKFSLFAEKSWKFIRKRMFDENSTFKSIASLFVFRIFTQLPMLINSNAVEPKSEKLALKNQNSNSSNFSSFKESLFSLFSLYSFKIRSQRAEEKLCYPILCVAHRFSTITMKNTTETESGEKK